MGLRCFFSPPFITSFPVRWRCPVQEFDEIHLKKWNNLFARNPIVLPNGHSPLGYKSAIRPPDLPNVIILYTLLNLTLPPGLIRRVDVFPIKIFFLLSALPSNFP